MTACFTPALTPVSPPPPPPPAPPLTPSKTRLRRHGGGLAGHCVRRGGGGRDQGFFEGRHEALAAAADGDRVRRIQGRPACTGAPPASRRRRRKTWRRVWRDLRAGKACVSPAACKKRERNESGSLSLICSVPPSTHASSRGKTYVAVPASVRSTRKNLSAPPCQLLNMLLSFSCGWHLESVGFLGMTRRIWPRMGCTLLSCASTFAPSPEQFTMKSGRWAVVKVSLFCTNTIDASDSEERFFCSKVPPSVLTRSYRYRRYFVGSQMIVV